MFSRLFGNGGEKRQAKQQAPDLNSSIQQLRTAISSLEKREVFLEKKIEACLAKAKQRSKARDKKGALFELKKKKQLESQLQSIQGKKLNLETQIMALEDAHLNKETLKAMKTSANAMKAAVKDADLDKADELMDDINDAIDQVHEMNDAMSQPIGQVMDDDELEAELAELEEMEADELLSDMPQSNKAKVAPKENIEEDNALGDDLPEVPKNKVAAKEDKNEDAELAELEQMMG